MEEFKAYPKEYRTTYSNSSSSSSSTSIHVTAQDGLVNVNSLFTIAVFVGLSIATPGQRSPENRGVCDATLDVGKRLITFEDVYFSFFLFSSLVAQGLKPTINLLNSKDVNEAFRAHINLKVLRFGMLGSAVGSVMGCVFLVFSMVNVVQIKLGLLSCGRKYAVNSVAVLVTLDLLLFGCIFLLMFMLLHYPELNPFCAICNTKILGNLYFMIDLIRTFF